MEIRTTGSGELTVTGTIKTIDDSTFLRTTVQGLVDSGASSITIKIEDSFAMPSAVIGYLMKLVNRDKIRLSILVGDSRLAELLEELQLTALFGVRTVSR